MKYCVLIIDGAADFPLKQYKNKTCLEIANTPNMDLLAIQSRMGMTTTVPDGMEPSSALACMSILGYDPRIYYGGRSAIEAKALRIPLEKHEFYFRCNLVSVKDGTMVSYSSGNISDSESHELLMEINNKLGSNNVHFFPGTSYRHICKIKGIKNILEAVTTPPHDITGKSIYDYLPHGRGSRVLRDYVEKSRLILQDHPINLKRIAENKLPANMIWLFWGSGEIPQMPPFQQVFGVNASLTSGVDLLKGLAIMANITVLDIKGVTDAFDNDYAAQMEGALKSLNEHDLVIIHVEAPDEAGHSGSVEKKVEAIENIDKYMVNQIISYGKNKIRVLIMPDHPTPIKVLTHTPDPVPFMIWGNGIRSNGVKRFTENEAKNTNLFVKSGHTMMNNLLK